MNFTVAVINMVSVSSYKKKLWRKKFKRTKLKILKKNQ
jgi:hypothetical protein